MAAVQASSPVQAPAFTRLLARLAGAEIPASGPALAERLGQWLDWNRAVGLSRALDGRLPDPVPTASARSDDMADGARVRASLAEAIGNERGLNLAATAAADFAPFRRYALATQRAMQAASGRLRGQLREQMAAIPALARLAAGIGDPAVRYRGTIGGSVANNDPAADYPAAVLALAATLTTNRRTIAADTFFRGLFETALGDGEILTRIAFPIPDKAGYAKFPHPASRFALTGVFVARSRAGAVRVAATGVDESGVFRVPAIEAALAASWSPDAAGGVAVSPSGLFSDIHASAEYRAHLVAVMAKRAVAAAG